MADFTPAEVEELCYMARWAVRQYRGNTQWDDLLAEAYVGMWRAVVRARATGKCSVSTAAVYGARWAALDFLRSPRCLDRRYTRLSEGGGPLPEVFSLDAPVRIGHPTDPTDPTDQSDSLFVRDALVPDEALIEVRVCERLSMRAGLAAVRRVCQPLEWEALARCVVGGETLTKAALALGVTVKALTKHRDRALTKARAVWEAQEG